MSLFLAVDAGGTKTDYVLADEVRELGRTQSGTIKRLRADEQTAALNLETGLAQLSVLTGVSMSSVDRTCIGTAGEKVPLVADWLVKAFRQRVGGDLILLGDVEIAFAAAFRGSAGVLVLAGTGSNVAGRVGTRPMITAGGWGPVLSDQGSGYRIGSQALRRAFLAIDEQRETQLLPAILEHFELSRVEELVEHVNSVPSLDPSKLAGLVVRCARSGDALASEVLTDQAEELAYLVSLVISRLRSTSLGENTWAKPWSPRLAFAGSIMQNVPEVRNALVQAVSRKFPDLCTLQGVVDPIDGALWHARSD